jgi:hypothetical protein
MNRFLLAVTVGAGAYAAPLAFGQFAGGVNIDFNAAAGAGAGQPTILYAGAAAQGGYWNPLNPPYTGGTGATVRDLGNSVNAVTCSFVTATATGSFAFNNALTSGDEELLLDDGHNLGGAGGSALYAIGSFAPGVYEVYTYAVAPDNASYRTAVSVYTADSAAGEQLVGGAVPAGGVLTQGVTHARHSLSLARSGPISISAATDTGFGSVNGVQIKRLSPTRLYVGPTGGPTIDGLSWGTALPTLPWAMAVAAATPSVTEIWVARGTYKVDAFPATAGSAGATIALRAGLSLYGGFLGTEATLAARPVFIFNSGTILDGTFSAGGGAGG